MIDWKNYRNQFPAKYWSEGTADATIVSVLEKLTGDFHSFLDVGGGTVGTLCVKDFVKKHNLKSYFLDPYVPKPDWIDYNQVWGDLRLNPKGFDLIVCRGAINYLTIEELKLLNFRLYGVFIFNTFLNPPSTEWSERPIVNPEGEHGLECVRLVNNIVEHKMVFGDKPPIMHTFNYYSPEDFGKYFRIKEQIEYKTNSVIYVMTHRD